ncbi:hypothetical protein L345_02764, partial [Ophiophagus hannah]
MTVHFERREDILKKKEVMTLVSYIMQSAENGRDKIRARCLYLGILMKKNDKRNIIFILELEFTMKSEFKILQMTQDNSHMKRSYSCSTYHKTLPNQDVMGQFVSSQNCIRFPHVADDCLRKDFYAILLTKSEQEKDGDRWNIPLFVDLDLLQRNTATITRRVIKKNDTCYLYQTPKYFREPHELWQILSLPHNNAHDRCNLFLGLIRKTEDVATEHDMYSALPNIMNFLPGPHKKVVSDCNKVCDFIRSKVDSHKKTLDPENPRDFIDCFLIKLEKLTASKGRAKKKDPRPSKLNYTISNENRITVMKWKHEIFEGFLPRFLSGNLKDCSNSWNKFKIITLQSNFYQEKKTLQCHYYPSGAFLPVKGCYFVLLLKAKTASRRPVNFSLASATSTPVLLLTHSASMKALTDLGLEVLDVRESNKLQGRVTRVTHGKTGTGIQEKKSMSLITCKGDSTWCIKTLYCGNFHSYIVEYINRLGPGNVFMAYSVHHNLLMKSKSQQLPNFTNPRHGLIIIQKEFVDLFVKCLVVVNESVKQKPVFVFAHLVYDRNKAQLYEIILQEAESEKLIQPILPPFRSVISPNNEKISEFSSRQLRMLKEIHNSGSYFTWTGKYDAMTQPFLISTVDAQVSLLRGNLAKELLIIDQRTSDSVQSSPVIPHCCFIKCANERDSAANSCQCLPLSRADVNQPSQTDKAAADIKHEGYGEEGAMIDKQPEKMNGTLFRVEQFAKIHEEKYYWLLSDCCSISMEPEQIFYTRVKRMH